MKTKRTYDITCLNNITQANIYDTYSNWNNYNCIKTIEKLDIWKILQQNDLSECVNKINEIIDTVNQLARR